MLENGYHFVCGYLTFYEQYFVGAWNRMTPLKYGTLLICCGIFGWVLMKAGNKRA
jgi:hypothetical protein